MSRNRNGPRLELKLNILPPRANPFRTESPNRSMSVSPSLSLTSPPSSCVSTELSSKDTDQGQTLGYPNSPGVTSMVLVGCPHCLMYVMLSEDSPRSCPKCMSTVLLDVFGDNSNNKRN
ncbi:hypothetical protein CKAN_02652300 [Cinnamomum micranthum f. kanehirae]|uniref:GIR1-like zinc ribbon domain-containing protein n=1 Tax=Cinnamomum micranthum f. kanehirae TaxID=337451 RepID=A0A443Q297_9MAGN|nr:hypothetical protein CKAN_02652300 [Cinnamomum micranthum f. kanehirae]